MQSELLDQFYKEQNPEKRVDILDDMISQGIDIENNQIRKDLLSIRYAKKKKQYADQFMAFWLMLKTYSASELRKREYPVICERLKKEMEKISHPSYDLSLKEWKHLVRLYVEICRTDRNYGSVIFGLGSIGNEKIEVKIKNDIFHVGLSFPKEIGMKKELAVITEATKSVLEEVFGDCK